MFSFTKRKQTGLTAICLYPGRVDVARVRRGAGKPVVEMLESFDRNEDDAKLIDRLRRSLKLDHSACATLLPVGKYQFLQLEAPEVPAEEMREAVRWKLRDIVDFPVDQATLDVVDIPSPPNGGGARARMLFAAACRNDAVEPLIRSFYQAKADLQAVDVLEMAQRNIATLGETGERGQALLAIYDDVGLLTFSAKGELYMVRRIDLGMAQLQEGGSRRDQLLDRIGLEVQRSLDNFDRQFSFIPVSRLLIAPNPLSGTLQEYLLDYLGMPVEVMDLTELLDVSAISGLDQVERQAQCLATLGVALREEEAA